MIEVSGLTKRYGDFYAINDVSFVVPRGQIVGFLGANGAGKTTTMDILCGCIGADRGSAKIAGFDITEHPSEAKRKLGYLPDIPPLHSEMIVEEFIWYCARLHQVARKEVKNRVGAVIEKLSLGDVRRRVIGNLSKGFRQRVALAQAIVHEPEVLVLDEPTEGLDPVQIVQIRELIRSLAGDHTIILSSHILSEVQNTCDHIIIIHKGQIVQQGTYKEIVTQFEAGSTYKMKLAHGAANLVAELAKLARVINPHTVGEDDRILEFSVVEDSDSVLETASTIAVSGGYGLRELTPKTKTLEDVFVQITK